MKYYSGIRRNEIILFAGKQMELENIILSEINQAQEASIICVLSNAESKPKKSNNMT
jgi:hypothetical protein